MTINTILRSYLRDEMPMEKNVTKYFGGFAQKYIHNGGREYHNRFYVRKRTLEMNLGRSFVGDGSLEGFTVGRGDGVVCRKRQIESGKIHIWRKKREGTRLAIVSQSLRRFELKNYIYSLVPAVSEVKPIQLGCINIHKHPNKTRK